MNRIHIERGMCLAPCAYNWIRMQERRKKERGKYMLISSCSMYDAVVAIMSSEICENIRKGEELAHFYHVTHKIVMSSMNIIHSPKIVMNSSSETYFWVNLLLLFRA